MATDYTWEDFIPPSRRRRADNVRRMISVHEDVHARIVEYAVKLDLTNPDAIHALLNLADTFDKGEL